MYNEIQISMRTWRSWMSAASQGAFVDIPKISHSDSSMYHKKQTPAFLCKSLLGCLNVCLPFAQNQRSYFATTSSAFPHAPYERPYLESV